MNKYIIIFCILSGCETLLPPENRTYPKPVTLIDSESLDTWLKARQKIHSERMFLKKYSDTEYSIKYYSQKKFSSGSYMVCSFFIRPETDRTLNLKGSYFIDYGCDGGRGTFWGDKCGQVRSEVGPTNQKEYEEYLLPCFEEFLKEN
ncbi:MAG TPA: hypothetical protein PL048_01150 [Leptospiraceae bacterium]|nr:hypothetical protein [Leptospiraceae bacterium]HMY66356.1 hypothetical protein [Leptospiraceae bacterium]HMZ57348.1 hypothetical protein [Leptospiraceae bacterium]HNF15491.1 hypothetical protein [Leptospiraceae bacterium]HNF22914.1 hypothetical protein [Leptospiraceae bacterium]